MLFNKALFKQSAKANGLSWLLITIMDVFMLACVMCIAGSDQLSTLVSDISQTIVEGEITGAINNGSINFFRLEKQSCDVYDENYVEQYGNYKDYTVWLGEEPSDPNSQAYKEWELKKPIEGYNITLKYDEHHSKWVDAEPELPVDATEKQKENHQNWVDAEPTPESTVAIITQQNTIDTMKVKIDEFTTEKIADYDLESYSTGFVSDALIDMAKTISIASIYFPKSCKQAYKSQNLEMPSQYDYESLVTEMNKSDGDIQALLASPERYAYKKERCQSITSNLLSLRMTKTSTILAVVAVLSEYNFTPNMYEEMGFQDFYKVVDISNRAVVSYESQYNYELVSIRETIQKQRDTEENAIKANITKYTDEMNASTSEEAKARYQKLIDKEQAKLVNWDVNTKNQITTKLAVMDEKLTKDCTKSLLSSLPKNVAGSLNESGTMDSYALIVANVYFKVSGLLLPIIFIILTSNNLIAGAVDKGSMAYVLSTGTKRESVVFTQAVYLITSLLAMFSLTYITSIICFSMIQHQVVTNLTFFKLFLLNAGSFLSMFAISGICFYCSCQFNRSKYAIGVGGGFSIFSLVATMLGLFGTKIIPSMVRFNSLNYFNYVSVITLFDIFAITDLEKIEAAGMCPAFWWEGAILFVIGLTGYIVGNLVFKKKDLPL